VIRHDRLRSLGVVLVLSALLLFSEGARAEEDGTVSTGIIGLSAGVCSIIYAPLKILYAGSGIAVSAAALLVSAGDSTAAARVFRKSVRGDYVVTPSHLRGDHELHFFGEG
jgi:hypothetical protein